MKFFQSLLNTPDQDLRDPIRAALAEAEPVTSAGAWSALAPMPFEGLHSVGFDRGSETLLAVSESGQCILDPTTGAVLFRSDEDDGFDAASLKATRLDHPAAERFDMAGLHGGGLRHGTKDGWSIERVICAGPVVQCVLQPPGASIRFLEPSWENRDRDTTFHLLARETDDIRAFGFSWTGQSLVLATPTTLRLWSRPAPLHLT